MGLWGGRYDDSKDASVANTVSDKDYRDLQARAGRANNHQRWIGSDEQMAASKRGAENYTNRWWN